LLLVNQWNVFAEKATTDTDDRWELACSYFEQFLTGSTFERIETGLRNRTGGNGLPPLTRSAINGLPPVLAARRGDAGVTRV
jgi:hypothetical protein